MNKLRMVGLVALMVAGLLGAGCARGSGPAADTVTSETLRAHTEFLADDLLEGRAPASRGSELAATYIAAQFRRLGLEPAGEDGTYFQSVPVVGKTVTNTPRLRAFGRGRRLSFQTSKTNLATAVSLRCWNSLEFNSSKRCKRDFDLAC